MPFHGSSLCSRVCYNNNNNNNNNDNDKIIIEYI